MGRFFIFVVVETYREARNAAEREGWRRRRHRIVQKGGLSRGWTQGALESDLLIDQIMLAVQERDVCD